MRFVDRSSVQAPLSLADIDSPAAAELISARVYYGAASPPEKCFDFSTYKGHDVRVALRALFGGCCAYCEAIYEDTQQVDVEHYRPKGGIEESPGHPGYWWLAMRWDNLLPSCADCNRRRKQVVAVEGMSAIDLQKAFEADESGVVGKLNSFPTVDGNWAQPEADPAHVEAPLLIDPTRDDPRDYLVWKLDGEIPIIAARLDRAGNIAQKGQASIDIYGLNRFGLVQSRLRILTLLEAISEGIDSIIESLDEANPLLRQSQLAAIDRSVLLLGKFAEAGNPHVSMVIAYIEHLKISLAHKMAQSEMLGA